MPFSSFWLLERDRGAAGVLSHVQEQSANDSLLERLFVDAWRPQGRLSGFELQDETSTDLVVDPYGLNFIGELSADCVCVRHGRVRSEVTALHHETVLSELSGDAVLVVQSLLLLLEADMDHA